jgi:hypothetical protein
MPKRDGSPPLRFTGPMVIVITRILNFCKKLRSFLNGVGRSL